MCADEVAEAARALIASYRLIDERFDAEVELRDDVSGLMVSGPKLMIGRDSIMPAHRLDALLAHEVSVHLLTYFNGAMQGLKIFRSGLATMGFRKACVSPNGGRRIDTDPATAARETVVAVYAFNSGLIPRSLRTCRLIFGRAGRSALRSLFLRA